VHTKNSSWRLACKHALARRVRWPASCRTGLGFGGLGARVAAAQARRPPQPGVTYCCGNLRRTQHRNADIATSQFHRQPLGERNNGMLGHCIGTNSRNCRIDLQTGH
jgi:hypothetical protein